MTPEELLILIVVALVAGVVSYFLTEKLFMGKLKEEKNIFYENIQHYVNTFKTQTTDALSSIKELSNKPKQKFNEEMLLFDKLIKIKKEEAQQVINDFPITRIDEVEKQVKGVVDRLNKGIEELRKKFNLLDKEMKEKSSNKLKEEFKKIESSNKPQEVEEERYGD